MISSDMKLLIGLWERWFEISSGVKGQAFAIRRRAALDTKEGVKYRLEGAGENSGPLGDQENRSFQVFFGGVTSTKDSCMAREMCLM